MSRRIVSLDGVRAFAVVFVIIDHLLLRYTYAKPTSFAARVAYNVGDLGVEIFFVLSGYLITTLLIRERKTTGSVNLRRFYGRRTRRIFPAYYFYLAVVATLGLTAGLTHVTFRAFAVDALYVLNFGLGGPDDWYTAHSWSLDVEEQFYLFWPAVVLFGLRFSTRFAIATIVAQPLIYGALYVAFPASRTLLGGLLFTRIDVLMFGALAALLIDRIPSVKRWFGSGRARAVAPIAIVVLLANIFLSALMRDYYRFTIGSSVNGLLAALVLPTLALQPRSAIAGFISAPPIAWFGRISYSTYLWQQLFIVPFPGSSLQRFPFNVVLAIACASVSYYLIERRFFQPQPVRIL